MVGMVEEVEEVILLLEIHIHPSQMDRIPFPDSILDGNVGLL